MLESLDFLHSSYMWIQTVLPCGKHCANNADWDCFKTLTLREILKIRNTLLEEHCALLEVIHLCLQVGLCKKQTSVSHSSTESEITSLDAGLRIDGLPALELWDLIVSLLRNVTQTPDRSGRPVVTNKNQRSQGKTNALNNIDCVLPKCQHQESLLYVFEDNEAVIQMIIGGRSAISVPQCVLIQWRNEISTRFW